MQHLTAQNYRAADLGGLRDFFVHYLEKYPDAKLISPEFYTYHPALEDGDNAFCVFDSQQQMVGFAPLFPVLTTDGRSQTGPHEFWTIILAKPGLETAVTVRDLLFSAILDRANQLKAAYGLSQTTLCADMMASQKADIAYLEQKGFTLFEQMHVMSRDTSRPVPAFVLPEGVELRPCKLSSSAEQAIYLEAFNTCFPEHPKTAADLQFLLQSSLWEKGSQIAAYSPAGELIGSILLYQDEANEHGITDDVLVLPGWRGQNIAKALISEGVKFFHAQGVAEVRLEVRASNMPALSVYQSMGYQCVNQESLLSLVVY